MKSNLALSVAVSEKVAHFNDGQLISGIKAKPPSGGVSCVKFKSSSVEQIQRHLNSSSNEGIAGRCKDQKRSKELLWKEFFSDPSQWWDHRFDKRSARYPDFKHKKTEDALWIDGRSVPKWAKAEFAAMKLGSVERSAFSWTEKIRRYVKDKQDTRALEVFQEMQRQGRHPDRFTFVSVLNACASLASLEVGKRVHSQLIESDCEEDLFVVNSLINMYVKCRSLENACRVFNSMPFRDVVSWSAMIMGYVKSGQGEKALKLFEQMQQEGVKANFVTHLAVLNACASIGALHYGRNIHVQVVRSGYETDGFMGSCLIDMYCKCGSMIDAHKLFDNMPMRPVVSWNALIAGYVKCGQGEKAIELYQKLQSENLKPDRITYVGVVNACADLGALEQGRCMHAQVVHSGCELDHVVGSALIDMYGKCDRIEDACCVFNDMLTRDVVSWSAMILGYNACGHGEKALELFQLMHLEQVEPSPVTYLAVLNACANVAALEEGRHVHAEVVRKGYETNFALSNSLIDMYAKCGSIDDACKVFDNMLTRNVVSWTTMIGGYAMHGLGKEALKLFDHMCCEVAEVDSTTFICLLSACSRAGLLDEGHQYFELMSPVFGVSADMGHYSCMVDLLGRLGHLDEAQAIIQRMSSQPEASIWMALLGACRIHGDVLMGEYAAKQVLALDPENVSGYLLLSNIYAAVGKWDCKQS
ncbi:hypothetical protein O6H91_Y001800 [Diphasiastrum complanatum]|nr:hypothetical protein O6H91_Y001800 [Diphasiastrum complanatum]